MDSNKIKELVSQMTVEEKASFCVGKDFWHVQGLERLGIPSVMLTDGPHGLRKQAGTGDHLGLGSSNPAICFPAGCATASSFDPEIAELVGVELGKLCQAEDVSTILGPAMNIKRSPLCGRNFEYLSEDPLVSNKMGAGEIKGIQSQNVGACPKHFLANNQELYRQTSNSIVDEQTLREIYLASFEDAVKEAKPWTIMCSYNKINGTYASENELFMTDILRGEWDFDGYMMTDWGACDNPVDSVAAGMDLCMPGPGPDNVRRIKEAAENGTLPMDVLDRAVERVLNIVFRYSENHVKDAVYDFEAGHEAARKVETESAILLKNEDAVLPLKEGEKIVYIGEYVKAPRYQGGGSSHINPYKISSVWDEVGEKDGVSYVKGYDLKTETIDAAAAAAAAKEADKAVIFAGLPDSYETEGLDRTHMDIPRYQNDLIAAVAAVQPNTIVVLHNGSPVSMPWIDDVKGVLELYLGGEAVGLAAADLLYGKVNPSGRLTETFPIRIEDTPTYPYYGVEKDDVKYREERLVGYRYYETVKKPVLFPFGYGLSYTTFAYDNLQLDKEAMTDAEELKVSVDVTNTGAIAGKEVVQIYVAPCRTGAVRPVRELRAFEKIALEPGETKTVTVSLSKRAFAEWNVSIHDWYVPSGVYQIQVGTSAADIVAEKAVNVTSTRMLKPKFTVNTAMGDIMAHPVGKAVLMQVMGAMMGGEQSAAISGEGDVEGDGNALSQEAMMATGMAMPLRAMVSFSPDATIEQMEQLIAAINQAIENA